VLAEVFPVDAVGNLLSQVKQAKGELAQLAELSGYRAGFVPCRTGSGFGGHPDASLLRLSCSGR
jgi:hypothetical protein